MVTKISLQPIAPTTKPEILALRRELAKGLREIANFNLNEHTVSVGAGRDAIWAIVRKPDGVGGLAVRAAHCPSAPTRIRNLRRQPGDALRIEVATASGPMTICFSHAMARLSSLRIHTELTPSIPLVFASFPRDVYPLGSRDDPLRATGWVEAAQCGLNSGLVYFHLDEPDFGSVLYFQNLTALNDYFLATGTTPDGAVGGEWPALGYRPPTPAPGSTAPASPLPAWKTVTIADTILVFHDIAPRDECDFALHFLHMLGAAYRLIDKPATEYRDWVARADQTLHDLKTAPATTIRGDGPGDIPPHADAERPDVLGQLSLIAAIREYTAWTKAPIASATQLTADLGTMRRHLPNAGDDSNLADEKGAVESWALYRPLVDLGRMALDGDTEASQLFLGSLDYAIRAARHFAYSWPLQFMVADFAVKNAARRDDRSGGGPGQNHVGGVYACVMLHAFELTSENRYLQEARAAIAKVKDLAFQLDYRANLIAWGASACIRLWRITGDAQSLRQSYIYLAAFFHNCAIWESRTGVARQHSNFFGVSCRDDDPDMALYACVDSFSAFERVLTDSGSDLDPTVRMLISEYCKYALDRAWFYYPDAAPAGKSRNAPVDPKRGLARQDLSLNRAPVGKPGQQMARAGAAFAFAARSFHQVEGAPFRLFCDHFLVENERISAHSLTLRSSGGDYSPAVISVVRLQRKTLPKIVVTGADGDIIRARHRSVDRIDYALPTDARVTICWA